MGIRVPHLRRPIKDLYLLGQKLVFCNSDFDESTTRMRPLMVYLYLTSVHLMGGCLMGVYLGRVSDGRVSHGRVSRACI
jgi:hypothetical protein